MPLPSSGSITASMINTELGLAPTTPFNVNGTAARSLAGKPSGAISFSDFHGKSSIPPLVVNFTIGAMSLISANPYVKVRSLGAVVSGGVGGYTYTWSYVHIAGTPITLSPTSGSTISAGAGDSVPNFSGSGSVTLTVVSGAQTVSTTRTVTLTYDETAPAE